MKQNLFSLTSIFLGCLLHLPPAFAQNRQPLDTQQQKQTAGDDFYQYAIDKKLSLGLPNGQNPNTYLQQGLQSDYAYIETIVKKSSQNKALNNNIAKQKLQEFYLSAKSGISSYELARKIFQQDMQHLKGINNYADLMSACVYLHKNNIAKPFFSLAIAKHNLSRGLYVPTLSTEENNLAYSPVQFLQANEKSAMFHVTQEITALFKLAGHASSESLAYSQTVLKIMQQLARLENPSATAEKLSLKEWKAHSPQLPWPELVSDLLGKPVDDIWLVNTAYFFKLESLLNQFPLADWKVYLEYAILRNSFLNQLHQEDVASLQTKKLKKSDALQITAFYGKDLIKQTYLNDFYIDKVDVMLRNLKIAFEQQITSLEWMSAPSKKIAIHKIKTVPFSILYPFSIKKYQELNLHTKDIYENIAALRAYNFQEKLNSFHKPSEYPAPNDIANGYFDGQEIKIFGGLLQAPYFYPHADDAINYGTLGAIIAHEMTHMLDPMRKSEPTFYNQTDQDAFAHKAKELIHQYSSYFVIDSIRLDGAITLSENIADLGGLSMAYKAFKLTKQGQGNRKIDGFTADQRVFLAWAKVWKDSYIPESAASYKPDPHPPGTARINGPVVNIDAWYEAFQVKQADNMYKPQDKRIKMW